MYSLESERLGLRPFTWEDLDFLTALNADPDVARYLGYGLPRTEDESRRLLEGFFKAYAEDSFGHLAVYVKSSGVLVGRCGLALIEVEAAPAADELPQWFWFRGSAPQGMVIVHETEVGYAFARQYWGSGFATESARAVRDYAFESLGAERLVAAIFPENHASRNVARKIGLTYGGNINAFGMTAEYYEIDKDDWSAAGRVA